MAPATSHRKIWARLPTFVARILPSGDKATASVDAVIKAQGDLVTATQELQDIGPGIDPTALQTAVDQASAALDQATVDQDAFVSDAIKQYGAYRSKLAAQFDDLSGVFGELANKQNLTAVQVAQGIEKQITAVEAYRLYAPYLWSALVER